MVSSRDLVEREFEFSEMPVINVSGVKQTDDNF